MGNIDQIDQLETYIIDLGNEIDSVKKASDYLKLIEEFQSEIKVTSTTLGQSNQQMKLIQDVVESKLDLFLASSRNIESKQQALEHNLIQISASLAELKQQQDKSIKGMIASFKEMNKLASQNKECIVSELNRVENEQKSMLIEILKKNKMFFGINAFLGISITGILVYLAIN